MTALRPDQQATLQKVTAAIASGERRIVVQAPTGFGKTVLAAELLAQARMKGQRAIFVVPALSLIDQTCEMLWRRGIHDIGVMQADHPWTDLSRPVQVASVQTLQRRMIPPADLVIVDEAHRLHRFYFRWFADPAWADVPIIGLSATPWTRGLGKLFSSLIIASTTGQLIREGHLSPFRVYAPSHPDLSGVRTVAGDFHEGDLAEVMGTAPLVGDAVETWLARGQDRPTLCFAVDRAHAHLLQEQFLRADVATEYVDAYTTREEREAIRKRFHAGEVRVVVNVGCLTTGIDWDIRCIILARPTKSEILFVQIIGRGLRTAEGKRDCLIFDHSDTHLRLGFVSDIHHDHLDAGEERRSGGGRTRSVALPKECPACHFLRPAGVHVCPACGFAPQRQADVHAIDGDLRELTRGREGDLDPQRWLAMLHHIARERGYQRGWVAHKYKEKFGAWPPFGAAPMPIAPSREVLNWVRSRQIAFAKARGKSYAGARS